MGTTIQCFFQAFQVRVICGAITITIILFIRSYYSRIQIVVFEFVPLAASLIERGARTGLVVDSLVLLVCGLSFIPPKREKECLANRFQLKICELVSGELSKCLYIRSYTDLITSSVLNECLLIHNFQNSCSTECH